MKKPKRADYKREPREKAKQMYLQGHTLQAIALELGVTRERVRQYLQELGVRRRRPGRRYEGG